MVVKLPQTALPELAAYFDDDSASLGGEITVQCLRHSVRLFHL